MQGTCRLFSGHGYSVDEHEIHTLLPVREDPTVLFLLQYHDSQPRSSVFPLRGEEMSMSGLYQKPTEDDIERMYDDVYFAHVDAKRKESRQ